MFVFVLTDKDGRDVFKFRAKALFQFDMPDDYKLSVTNYKELPAAEADAPKASSSRQGRRNPTDTPEG